MNSVLDSQGGDLAMQADLRLLVIGSEPFAEAVVHALPQVRSTRALHPLEGVWAAGRDRFDAALLSLGGGKQALRAVPALRQAAPQTRLVITAAPVDEPAAQRALRQGADDYIIEPVLPEDLERALHLPERPSTPKAATIAPPGPSLQEKAQFVDVLKNLPEGPQAAAQRLAELIRQTFAASFVTLEVDGVTVVAGASGAPVLQEPIHRGDQQIGLVALGPPPAGAFGATAAARLADYARLIEAVVTVANDRIHWQDLAWTDDLTQLRNRRYFDRELDRRLERCAAERAHLTLLLFDIDHFKAYNDQFGHDVGDAVLREVASLLARCTRDQDLIARYGGDEFAVAFWDAETPRVPGSRHPSEPAALAERFCQALRTHHFSCLGSAAPGEVTISGGLASFPWDGTEREALVRAADMALLEAKQTGRNRIQIARPGGAEAGQPAESHSD